MDTRKVFWLTVTISTLIVGGIGYAANPAIIDDQIGVYNFPWFNATVGMYGPRVIGGEYFLGTDNVTDHLTASLVEPASYIIYKSGSTYYAKNGTTGEIEFTLTTATDCSSLLQDAYDALPTGGELKLRDGIYQTQKTLVFDDGEKWVIGESQNTQIYYKNASGTEAIRWGTPTAAKNRGGIRNLRIYGYGSAETGLMVFSRYSVFENIWINSFHAGTGLELVCNYSGGMYFNNFYNLRFNDNLYDIKIGENSAYGTNANTFYGPVLDAGFGTDVGIVIETKGDTNVFYNPKINSKNTAIVLNGPSNEFYTPRIESCTFGFNVTGNNNNVLQGTIDGATIAVTDSGTGNLFKEIGGYVTENIGQIEANNGTWITHGLDSSLNVGLDNCTIGLSVNENDYSYQAQVIDINATKFQIELNYASQYFTYDGSKIADITHADTDEHNYTTSSVGLPNNTQCIITRWIRSSGTGFVHIRTTTGGTALVVASDGTVSTHPIADDDLFHYRLTVANDDWDLHCFGYWTGGVVTSNKTISWQIKYES